MSPGRRGTAGDLEAAGSARYDAVDVIKTAAIIAVIFTHSVLGSWREIHTVYDDIFGRGWVSFHVPSFLAVSGFLYCSVVPVPGRKIFERLVRILVPYLVASFVALALGDVPAKDPSFWVRLATGNTQGHYYYVVLIASYVPLVWVLSRLHARWIYLIFAFFVLYPLLAYEFQFFRFSETHVARMRNPVYTAIYFIAGWVLRMALPELRRLRNYMGTGPFWAVWIGIAAVCVVSTFAGTHGGERWQIKLANRMIYTAGALILLCGITRVLIRVRGLHSTVWKGIGFVSGATYTIYLYHFFFIYPMRAWTLHWSPIPRIFAVATTAFVGGCLVSWAGQRLLGRRARWWIG